MSIQLNINTSVSQYHDRGIEYFGISIQHLLLLRHLFTSPSYWSLRSAPSNRIRNLWNVGMCLFIFSREKRLQTPKNIFNANESVYSGNTVEIWISERNFEAYPDIPIFFFAAQALMLLENSCHEFWSTCTALRRNFNLPLLLVRSSYCMYHWLSHRSHQNSINPEHLNSFILNAVFFVSNCSI